MQSQRDRYRSKGTGEGRWDKLLDYKIVRCCSFSLCGLTQAMQEVQEINVSIDGSSTRAKFISPISFMISIQYILTEIPSNQDSQNLKLGSKYATKSINFHYFVKTHIPLWESFVTGENYPQSNIPLNQLNSYKTRNLQFSFAPVTIITLHLVKPTTE